ncbi:MAG: hypothetical protein AAF633_16175, partial [Chloroflexota bacterium]
APYTINDPTNLTTSSDHLQEEWVLQIAISQPKEGYEPGKAIPYKFEAWLNQIKSENEGIKIFPLPSDDKIENFQFDNRYIGQKIGQLLQVSKAKDKNITTLEFFLPTDKLFFKVDDATYYDELFGKSEWVYTYKIFIRSYERAFGFPNHQRKQLIAKRAPDIWKRWESKTRHLREKKRSRLITHVTR